MHCYVFLSDEYDLHSHGVIKYCQIYYELLILLQYNVINNGLTTVSEILECIHNFDF